MSSPSSRSSGGGGMPASFSYTDEYNLKMAVVEYQDIVKLIKQQPMIDYHEWLAFNTKMFFDQINILFGAISDCCTTQTCPTMSAPNNTQFHWLDEKGKKFKYSASQYIDTVLSYTAKTIGDEALFPTLQGRHFPANFEPLVKKLLKHLFHVLAHMYHMHYKELLALKLNTYINSIYFHLYSFARATALLDEKDMEIMDSLNRSLMGKFQQQQDAGGSKYQHQQQQQPTIHQPTSTVASSSSAAAAAASSSNASGSSLAPISYLKKKLNFNLMA